MRQEYDFSSGERGKFFRQDAGTSLPGSGGKPDWIGTEGRIAEFIAREAKRTLSSYRAQPRRVVEDANSEQIAAHGGYAHRQLFELVQNSADALLDSPKGRSILIRLTDGFLYCADDGEPIDEDGIVGLMFSRMSSKRNTAAIGRFGLGFKSVLGVTDSPEFYSRSGAFRFDKACAGNQRSYRPSDRPTSIVRGEGSGRGAGGADELGDERRPFASWPRRRSARDSGFSAGVPSFRRSRPHDARARVCPRIRDRQGEFPDTGGIRWQRCQAPPFS